MLPEDQPQPRQVGDGNAAEAAIEFIDAHIQGLQIPIQPLEGALQTGGQTLPEFLHRLFPFVQRLHFRLQISECRGLALTQIFAICTLFDPAQFLIETAGDIAMFRKFSFVEFQQGVQIPILRRKGFHRPGGSGR
jgi:hypothetical protein